MTLVWNIATCAANAFCGKRIAGCLHCLDAANAPSTSKRWAAAFEIECPILRIEVGIERLKQSEQPKVQEVSGNNGV